MRRSRVRPRGRRWRSRLTTPSDPCPVRTQQSSPRSLGETSAGWRIGAGRSVLTLACTHIRLSLMTRRSPRSSKSRVRSVGGKWDARASRGHILTEMSTPGWWTQHGRWATRPAERCRPAFIAAGPLSWPRIGVYRRDDLRRFRLKTSAVVRGLRTVVDVRRGEPTSATGRRPQTRSREG